MTESRVAKTPSVEEALRHLTSRVAGPGTSILEDGDSDPRIGVDGQMSIDDRIDIDDPVERRDGVGFEDRAELEDREAPDGFDDINSNTELNVTARRYVKRTMGGHALADRETATPATTDQCLSEPVYAPMVDVDVLLAALHGGDDEPLRRLSAIAIASERDAILASAKAEAQLLVSEAQSHRKAILAQAESKSEIMIARAEAHAAATVARAEARAQLLELENRNQSVAISQRKKRKQR